MTTILIVDDHADLRELVKIKLEKHGFNCVEARDGKEALATLQDQPVDLVVLVLNMPEVDGWQAASQIRASTPLCSLPIIALSAYTMQGDRARAIAAGCDAFHCKPIDFSSLLDDIQRLLA